MKYLFFLMALFVSSFVFSDNEYSSREKYLQSIGLSDSCDSIKDKINNEVSNVLVVIYYLGVEFRCFKKNNKKIKKELLVKIWSEYSGSINGVFKKKFNADTKYNLDLVEINMGQPWNAENNEKIKKYYIEMTLENPPFDETGEHPFKPEVFLFKQYEDIASAYFAAGMPEEGERIIQELGKLPHQSEGKVQNLMDEMKVIYPGLKPKPKQSENKNEKLPELEKTESLTPKLGKKQVINAPEPDKKPVQSTNPVAPKPLFSPDNRSNDRTMYYVLGVLILLLLIVGVVRKRAIKK